MIVTNPTSAIIVMERTFSDSECLALYEPLRVRVKTSTRSANACSRLLDTEGTNNACAAKINAKPRIGQIGQKWRWLDSSQMAMRAAEITREIAAWTATERRTRVRSARCTLQSAAAGSAKANHNQPGQK